MLGLRPPEQSVETELLTELVSDPTVLVIRPAALSETAVNAMVVSEYGREPQPEFVAACHSATGGNPLFVRALVAALHGEGVEPVAQNARRAHEIGPEPVARAVALRLSRLPEEARRFATAAAVLGDGAELRDVAALAGLEDSQLATLAAIALARGELLRVTTPTVEFSHPVVRAAVYESIEPAQRLLAHRQAAELLLRAAAQSPSGWPRTSTWCRLRETHSWWTRCAWPRTGRSFAARPRSRSTTCGARWPSRRRAETRVDTLAELGLAEQRVDVLAAAEHLQKALLGTGEPLRYARLGLQLGRSLFRLNRGPEAVTVFEQAIERLGDDAPELRELLEAELINSAGFDSDVFEVTRSRLGQVDEDALTGTVGRAAMVATLRYFDTRRGVGRERVAALAEPAILGPLCESMPSVAISCAAWALHMRRGRPRARPLLRGRDGDCEEARRAGHALEHALLPRPGARAPRGSRGRDPGPA